MGTAYLTVTFHLRGRTPCRLEGRPSVQLLSNGVVVDIPQDTMPSFDGWPGTSPVAVSPHDPATVTIGWAVSHFCGKVGNIDSTRITVPGLAPVTTLGFGTPTCDTPGVPQPRVEIGPVTPQTYVPAHASSPYDAIKAAGDLHLTGKPGQVLHFTVTLTSPRGLVLDPCPDYKILMYGETTSAPSYALNCAAVPFHDARGRPYLPPHTPVRFAMRLTVPDHPVVKMFWMLDTPRSRVNVVGGLTLR